MTKPPPLRRNPYNQSLAGVYGEFGSGVSSQAFYIQSAMPPRDLKHISLVSDIPGSEKWPVRALFQRDIDEKRVTEGLLPYLRNIDQVRFFNPLTLTLLPMDALGHTVLADMPHLKDGSMELDGEQWTTLERKDFYRLRWMPEAPQYAVLEWNDTRSELVAIDGQHRLFGLKRLWGDTAEVPPGEDFRRWRIPVVVVSFRGVEHGQKPPTVLDTVRRIFVSINTQAQPVNDARRILLSDDSINALCTQELVQLAHSNDTASPEDQIPAKVPLIFFDWRGEESQREAVRSPAAVKTTVEIRDWFKHYFLGPDFSGDQQDAMEVVPPSDLHAAFQDEPLTHDQAEHVRSWARSEFLPALSHLLEHFVPYQQYISALRAIEEESRSSAASDLHRHAFEQLRFGSNRGEEAIQAQVKEELNSIRGAIERAKKEHLDKVLQEDIGLRGIAYAFGYLRPRFSGPPDWVEYAKRFTEALNRVRSDGWLSLEPKAKHRRFLLHVAEDHAETVVNYRLESAANALGAHVALLVGAYGMPWPSKWKFAWDAYMEESLGTLEATLRRGYRRQFRPELREQHPEGGRVLTDAVNKKAERNAGRRVRELRSVINKIVMQQQSA